MDESIIRREVYQMLRYAYNLWPDHFADVPASKQPGRPDLVVMNPYGAGFYVEVKAFNLGIYKSFSFSWIKDEQRRWLDEWESIRPFGSHLAIGVYGMGHRELYIVHWLEWKQIESIARKYQNSLPYEIGPGYKVQMQEKEIDFRRLVKWQCIRIAPKVRLKRDSGWRFGEEMKDRWISEITYRQRSRIQFPTYSRER